MLSEDILWDDSGILWFGKKGEGTYGRKNFLELVSIFLSPPLFSVLHGREALGFVDDSTFLGKQNEPRVLLLGGRAWRVTHIDWQRRVAHVEAVDSKGASRWRGEGQGFHIELCQSIKGVLASDVLSSCWSRRACDQIVGIRLDYPWIKNDDTAVVSEGDDAIRWWTFAGQRANQVLAQELSRLSRSKVKAGNLALLFEPRRSLDDVRTAITELKQVGVDKVNLDVDDDALDGLKFSACLPTDVALEMLGKRLADLAGASRVLGEPARFVSLGS